jgi:hypothetical protein
MFFALVLFAILSRLSSFGLPCEEQDENSSSKGKANRTCFMANLASQ